MWVILSLLKCSSVHMYTLAIYEWSCSELASCCSFWKHLGVENIEQGYLGNQKLDDE